MRNAAKVAPLVVALSLAACGTGSSSRSVSSSASPLASAAQRLQSFVNAEWVDGKDPATNVTFRLPGAIKPQQRPVGVLYANDLGGSESQPGAASLSVGFTLIEPAMTSEQSINGFADSFSRNFRAAGAPKDFAITERMACTMGTNPCLDMRIGFTPLGKPTMSMLWLIRAIAWRHHVIVVQTVTVVPKNEATTDLQIVRTLQSHIIASLRTPAS